MFVADFYLFAILSDCSYYNYDETMMILYHFM